MYVSHRCCLVKSLRCLVYQAKKYRKADGSEGGRGRLQDYISCLVRRRNSPVIGMDTKTEKTFKVNGWIETR